MKSLLYRNATSLVVLSTLLAPALHLLGQATSQPATHKPITDVPVIGAMSPSDQNTRLTAMGQITTDQAKKNIDLIHHHHNGAQAIHMEDLLGFGGGGAPQIWKYTTHQFGFIPVLQAGGPTQVAIQQAGTITADTTLKGQAVKITLDRLRVAAYPGNGRHKILFTFRAQNAVSGNATETATFSQDYEVLQGQSAPIAGYPVYVGLHVPNEGIFLDCHTTNVSNDNDEKVMSFLGSSSLQSGLKLLDTANPIIPVVSDFAVGLMKDFESRNENVGVQDFYMGLDFSTTGTGIRVAQGSYVVIQAPDENWSWSKIVYDIQKGQVVNKADGSPIPYNYVVFAIQKM